MRRIAVQSPDLLIIEIEDLRAQKKYLLNLLEQVMNWKNTWNEIQENIIDVISKNR